MLKRREPLTKVRLGHADTQITARVYTHWITTADEVGDADLTLPINEGKTETMRGVEFLLNMPLAKVEDTA